MNSSAIPAHPAADVAGQGLFRLLRLSLNAHALLLGLVLLHLAGLLLLQSTMPGMKSKPGGEVFLGSVLFSFPTLLLGLAVFLAVDMAIRERPARPIQALWQRLTAALVNRRMIAHGLPAALALTIFIFAFTMLKANVPVLNPFAYDRAFDRFDAALHFGYRPWQLLQPLLGLWPVTFLINLNYHVWFVVMNVFLAYFTFLREPGTLRTRFFSSYLLIWILGGGVLAVLFSSAGPCYWSELGLSPDPYAPLMAYLNGANAQAPILALQTQDLLWNLHAQGSGFAGISAMPSMHVATAMLFVLASAQAPRWIRIALNVHLALIFTGSIHLGWHYAVDGYVAIALTLCLWRIAGPISVWWEQTQAARDYRAAIGGRP